MGRSPCCAKEGLNRGAWSVIEDKILTKYISVHGEGKWRDLPQRAGLKRCGKSCRLRWLNYLRPDIKRGSISVDEEDLIIKLHKLLGNRWSLIAGRLPGRTDNEIKNYWNTNLSKKGEQAAGNHKPQDSSNKDKQSNKNKLEKKGLVKNSSSGLLKAPEAIPHQVIRTRAVRCTRVIIPQNSHNHIAMVKENVSPISDHHDTTTSTSPSSSAFHDGDGSSNFMMDFDINDLLVSDILNSNFYQANELVRENGEYAVDGDRHYISNNNITFGYDDEAMLDESTNEIQLYENWTASDQLNEAMELKTLASFFNSEEMNR